MAARWSVALTPHPDTHGTPVRSITVEVDRPAPDRLGFMYILSGDIDRVLLPPQTAHDRADGLWRHTCFEVFSRDDQGYSEFNFSPSLQWAAYRFDGYRRGMRPLDAEPVIGWTAKTADTFTLSAGVRVQARTSRLALSAVIEDADGALSYWALTHPPGEADFHHEESFSFVLPAEIA